ncbi:DUF2800 domain-containing protein [Anaerovibrio lipolyticus]|uniref:DUF2800 domain-containing protein n=1 Tax=Anaerovibrio lipolyticus TaxID=82374 RepID=UPI0026F1A741|nr:DUF2800 domain-containing protein [Anaerovibrio lipolyticus]MBE6105277.1 DUF2800 domain-containing protein [Anaerovibrio lipolyticus]
MPKAHAILSASAAARWLHCTPSVRLGENYEDRTSEYAAEGTEAHALGEYKILKALKRKATNPTKKLKFFSEEMDNCTDGYRDTVMELLNEAKEKCPDPEIFIEQRVDFSNWVPEGFGTADALIVADDIITICDYKHGKGVLVDATDNAQLKCYALGALAMFDGIYDISTVRMLIYQPRLSNISEYEMPKDALYKWAEEELRPRAELAYKGEGDFSCGEWCRFCKVRHECRARAEANLLLAKYDFQMPPTLSDSEIEVILEKVDDLVSWANDIKAYALQLAIAGKEWQGWKLVEGRSNRKISNEEAVIEAVTNLGKDPFEKKLLGITALEKLLGKSKFNELIGQYVIKPPGKPTLVPESDKREAINSDFKEEN